MTIQEAMLDLFGGEYGSLSKLSRRLGKHYQAVSALKNRYKRGTLRVDSQITLLESAGYSVEIIVTQTNKNEDG